jgi:hypothetical protein
VSAPSSFLIPSFEHPMKPLQATALLLSGLLILACSDDGAPLQPGTWTQATLSTPTPDPPTP